MTFSYDDATREAYAAAPADTVLLDTLEFLHPSFTFKYSTTPATMSLPPH